MLALQTGAWAADSTSDDDNTRAVHIIEAPDPPATAPPPPPATSPSTPVPKGPAGLTPPPPSPGSSSAAAPPASRPGPDEEMRKPQQKPFQSAPLELPPLDYPTPRKQAALGPVPIDVKTANVAELALELQPGLEVPIGAKVSFRVTAKKPGYLVLVDVDPDGKLTQIYPVPSALVGGRPVQPNANFIKPGRPLQIPASGDAYAGIEYVVSPPSGIAMIVAILSDQPVQMLDLPDVPPSLTGQADALTYLTKFLNELRIPSDNRLAVARWSLDAKFYAVR